MANVKPRPNGRPRKISENRKAAARQSAKPKEENREPRDSTDEFYHAIVLAASKKEQYVLRLYVTGSTPRSLAAITNIRRLCEEYLKGRYDLEVVDIYQQPVLARGEQIIAAPTLIKKLPAPLRKVVGDLSNELQVLL